MEIHQKYTLGNNSVDAVKNCRYVFCIFSMNLWL